MTDAERIEINNFATSIMEGATDPQDLFAGAKRVYDLTKNSDWTPCAEGLPYLSENYIATYFNEITEKTYCDFLFFDAKQGRWKAPDGGRFTKYERVLAWQPLPEPYNPDHFVDANKKADQFREPTKMIKDNQEERQ